MIIRQGALVIRSAGPEDAPRLCAWWNDGRVMAHAGFPMGLGTTVQAVAEGLQDGRNQVMVLEVDGTAVGEMNYRAAGEGTAEIGIKICEAGYQEQGYGTSFLKMLIRYLFDVLGYQKIILDTNLTNVRAQHVYEKIGFRRAAVHIDSWQDQLGQWQSSVDYHLTKDEYLRVPGVDRPDRNQAA